MEIYKKKFIWNNLKALLKNPLLIWYASSTNLYMVSKEKLYEALVGLGFTSAKFDRSLFTRFTMYHTTFLLVYVDDILVTGSNPCVIQQLISQLNKSFFS